MATSQRLTEPAVLTSWKEVASYLGKGVRTVQRWEKQDGLPIRRIAGTSKIVVDREELDHWLKAQPVDNGGGNARGIEVQELHASLSQSKELRLRHYQLRLAVNDAMQLLMTECKRMTSICSTGASDLGDVASGDVPGEIHLA